MISRLVLTGDLSPKWLRLEQVFAETGTTAVTRCQSSPAEILAHCRRLIPCTLVLSDSLVDNFGVGEFCKAVDFGQSILVLVETAQSDLARAEHLIRLGCAGLLSRTATGAEARRAVGAIQDGEFWASRKTISYIMRKVLREAKHHLSVRESEVLTLMAEGLKNHEIAARLFISPQTVRWHLRSLYTKLGTHDRVRAAIGARSSL